MRLFGSCGDAWPCCYVCSQW